MSATESRRASTRKMFAPTAWQWDPASLTPPNGKVQWWSAEGSMSSITTEKARDLVRQRAAFVGSSIHVCQVHDRIDSVNA